eukprot:GHVS01038081.1.p1 GENE.GHVS01038081.1~~GHVS01038081.1.p1  ORF type:complete len:583 (+),score=70.55 GHVS01038081.1:57-1805(+)
MLSSTRICCCLLSSHSIWSRLCCSLITGLLMGFDLSIVATVLPGIVTYFDLCPGQFTCFAKQLFVSILAPGAAVGGIIGGVAADACGRRLSLALSDAFVVVGSLMLFFACSFGLLLVGRLFVGVGIGIGFVLFSTYISEIAPADRRGQLVTCQELAQCAGVLLTYAGVNVLTPSCWRALLSAPGVVALIQMFGILWLPESPRWLISRGRTTDAKDVIRQLGVVDEQQAVRQIEAMCREKRIEVFHIANTTYSVRTASNEQSTTTTDDKWQWTEYNADCPDSSTSGAGGGVIGLEQPCLLNDRSEEESSESGDGVGERRKEMWWSCRHLCGEFKTHKVQVITAIGVGICQNLIATNAMLYYSYDLFTMAGVGKPNVLGIGLGLMKLVGVVTTFLVVDTIGRRKLLLWGSIGTLACHLLLVVSFIGIQPDLSFRDMDEMSAISGDSISASSWLPWLFSCVMFAFMFFWEISWASLVFVVTSEVLPSHIRGVGMGVVVLSFWVTCFLSQISFETSFYLLTPPGTFSCLSILNVFVVVFVYLCIPETKGRSLEQISGFFRQHDRLMSGNRSERIIPHHQDEEEGGQ